MAQNDINDTQKEKAPALIGDPSDPVLLEVDYDSQIATLWLNRPEKRNALNYAIFRKLKEHLDWLSQQSDIRVVFLRAKGPIFSSGIDLGLLSGADKTAPKFDIKGQEFKYALTSILQPTLTALTLLEKPIIALIQEGICYGSGFELVLACDIRYAMKKTKFHMLESRLGIIPDLGGTTRLLRLVNPSYAKEIILAAREVSGEEAFRMGFVNNVFDSMEDMEQAALKLAEEFKKSAPLAVGIGKRLIDEAYGQPESVGLRMESMANSILFKSKDFMRAISAWLEKKPPKWRGN